MTHKELVEVAARWLRARSVAVVTELASGGHEEPDAIGWHGRSSIVLECKVSRRDFSADKKKWTRYYGGMGSQRYFLAPPGLVDPKELPMDWGLLEYADGKVWQVVECKPRGERRQCTAEIALLLSTLRRIGQQAPKGVSIRCYTYETKNRATLGVATDVDEPES